MKQQEKLHGLTTTKALFIKQAQSKGELFIHQPYELYNQNNQEAWGKLYALMRPKWEKYANKKFMEGIQALWVSPNRIPKLEDVDAFLKPLTGFKAKAVSGYVPTRQFFNSLKHKEFPTTVTIRDKNSLTYMPEPDIFHDIAGHVPMHTDKTFAKVLIKLGSLADKAAQRHAHVKNVEEKLARIKCNIQALSRFFWFTIEFGIIREEKRICVYGSGLLSSSGEIEHSLESPTVQRYPFQLEWVINQSYEINHFQPLLFIVDSFDHLYEQVDRLESWLDEGKLDFVSSGEPHINDEELKAFLEV